MRICKKALDIGRNDNYFVVKTNEVDVRIYFLTDDIIRIRAGFDGNFKECSYSLALTAWDSVTDELMKDYRTRVEAKIPTLSTSPKDFVLTGSKLKVIIHKEPYQLEIQDLEGNVLHRDCVDLALQEDSNHRRIHVSEIEPTDGFYGFGEKSGEFNKSQAYMSMSPTDAMGYDPEKTDSLYKHIPFYIKLNKETKRAAGYFYHSTSEVDFDMGRRKSNYWHMHSTFRANSGDIDLFFIAGPSVKEVVSRYTDLTGKSCLLPKAALGYLGSSMYYSELDKDCDEKIIDFVKTAHEEDIGVDGFQLSSGYCNIETSAGLKRCVFTWNNERFSNPKSFFQQMDKLGVVVSPNVKPGILTVHPKLEEFKEHQIFVTDSKPAQSSFYEKNSTEPCIGTWWGGPGHFVDYTKSSTREYWKQLLKDNLFEYGCYSIWNDNCEYDSIVDKDCRCHLEGLGCTIGDIKSVMSSIMCHITIDAINEYHKNKRPFVVCRSGHAGIQRYAQTWSGDNLTGYPTLKYNIGTMLGMSLSGVANQGSDIGGFYGIAPSEELFVRWVQNGIFQPRFSIHSVNTDNSVTEPWMYSNSKQLIHDAIDFRYKLSPYLYSLMYRASVTGLPYFSPMLLEFQQDPKVYDEAVNFMLGSSLLVANVIEEGAKTREVYFPEGETFYDLKDYKRFDGGKTYTLDVDMSSIPMFIREGGIIALAQNKIRNLHKDKVTSLALIAACDKDGSFTLYEDDGVSNDYKNGNFHTTEISMKAGPCTKFYFKHNGKYESDIKNIHLTAIHQAKCPFFVEFKGQKLEHFLNRERFNKATSGWYYSQTKKAVEIKYTAPNSDYEISISFEHFDMVGMQQSQKNLTKGSKPIGIWSLDPLSSINVK